MGVWEYEQLDDVTNQLWVPHVSGQIDFVQACTVKARRFKITFCGSLILCLLRSHLRHFLTAMELSLYDC